MDTINLRGNIYNQPFRNIHKRKNIQLISTIQNLPNMPSSQNVQRFNRITRDVSATKWQIVEMKAKIKKLQHLKQKYDLQKEHNLTKIQFLEHIKSRVSHDHEQKNKINQKKNRSLDELKYQVGNLKESLVRQKKMAESSMKQMKKWAWEEEREMKKHHEYLIQKLKELDKLDNLQKVKKVKAFHQQSASKMKQYHHSRVNMSKENYKRKVISALKQRESVSQVLMRMKIQEQKLMREALQSQQKMLTSLYGEQLCNPQKKERKGSFIYQFPSTQKVQIKETKTQNV